MSDESKNETMNSILMLKLFRNAFEPLYIAGAPYVGDFVQCDKSSFDHLSRSNLYQILCELPIDDVSLMISLLPAALYNIAASDLPIDESYESGFLISGNSLQENQDFAKEQLCELLNSRWFVMEAMLEFLIIKMAPHDVDGAVCLGLSKIRYEFFKLWPQGYPILRETEMKLWHSD